MTSLDAALALLSAKEALDARLREHACGIRLRAIARGIGLRAHVCVSWDRASGYPGKHVQPKFARRSVRQPWCACPPFPSASPHTTFSNQSSGRTVLAAVTSHLPIHSPELQTGWSGRSYYVVPWYSSRTTKQQLRCSYLQKYALLQAHHVRRHLCDCRQ